MTPDHLAELHGRAAGCQYDEPHDVHTRSHAAHQAQELLRGPQQTGQTRPRRPHIFPYHCDQGLRTPVASSQGVGHGKPCRIQSPSPHAEHGPFPPDPRSGQLFRKNLEPLGSPVAQPHHLGCHLRRCQHPGQPCWLQL